MAPASRRTGSAQAEHPNPEEGQEEEGHEGRIAPAAPADGEGQGAAGSHRLRRARHVLSPPQGQRSVGRPALAPGARRVHQEVCARVARSVREEGGREADALGHGVGPFR